MNLRRHVHRRFACKTVREGGPDPNGDFRIADCRLQNPNRREIRGDLPSKNCSRRLTSLFAKIGAVTQRCPRYQRQNSQLCLLRFKKEIGLEIAHVLFLDIVGYSKLSVNEQHARVDELNGIVRLSEQFQKLKRPIGS
jgi:hypothetical protein